MSSNVKGKIGLEMRVGVVGGGLSGLSCAYRAAKYCRPSRVAVFEADSTPGGWVKTTTTPSGALTRRVYIFKTGYKTAKNNLYGLLAHHDFLLKLQNLNPLADRMWSPYRPCEEVGPIFSVCRLSGERTRSFRGDNLPLQKSPVGQIPLRND